MPIEKPVPFDFAPQMIECLLANGVTRAEFNRNISEGFTEKPIYPALDLIINELADNCMEKGAKEIIITLSDNSLRVEDDVVEKEPEKVVAKLNEIKGSKNNGEKDSWKRKMYRDVRGVGISELVLGNLEAVGGKLKYLIDGGRIVALATWP